MFRFVFTGTCDCRTKRTEGVQQRYCDINTGHLHGRIAGRRSAGGLDRPLQSDDARFSLLHNEVRDSTSERY